MNRHLKGAVQLPVATRARALFFFVWPCPDPTVPIRGQSSSTQTLSPTCLERRARSMPRVDELFGSGTLCKTVRTSFALSQCLSDTEFVA